MSLKDYKQLNSCGELALTFVLIFFSLHLKKEKLAFFYKYSHRDYIDEQRRTTFLQVHRYIDIHTQIYNRIQNSWIGKLVAGYKMDR